MPHIDEGLLHAYLDEELAGSEREQLLAHLSECAACRLRLEEERALVARAGELLARATPPGAGAAGFRFSQALTRAVVAYSGRVGGDGDDRIWDGLVCPGRTARA